ncbi:hypothetical protein D3C85_1918530 [compost metagenome]
MEPFQKADLLGQRWLAHFRSCGRSDVAAVGGYEVKGPQMREIHRHGLSLL